MATHYISNAEAEALQKVVVTADEYVSPRLSRISTWQGLTERDARELLGLLNIGDVGDVIVAKLTKIAESHLPKDARILKVPETLHTTDLSYIPGLRWGVLTKHGYSVLGDLDGMTHRDILRIPFFGPRNLKAITSYIKGAK